MTWAGRKVLAVVGLAGALTVGGCAYDDGYGYGGMSVGTGYYGGGGYYDGYGPGYYDGGYGGWYNDYYYPGTGYYVFDRSGRRSRWNDNQRRYWEARRHNNGGRPNMGNGRPNRPGIGDGRPNRPSMGNGRPNRPDMGNGRPDRPTMGDGNRPPQNGGGRPNVGNPNPGDGAVTRPDNPGGGRDLSRNPWQRQDQLNSSGQRPPRADGQQGARQPRYNNRGNSRMRRGD